ncbi:unnamed protein product [Gongylonema pulchrum]|uniref:Protein grainyhead n=1 Tax=Gongylonema pulchrum TaxID=637853 RepID=A0A183CYS4_9BILA|nr:unnamed protein product [Gongylonema pulchrum]
MKLESFDSQSPVRGTATMSSSQSQQQQQQQFHLDSSSVIKTAPPGRGQQQQQQHDFSPKSEPIDLAPLSQPSLQDLSKMQPIEQYYSMPSYSRVYTDYAAIGLAQGQTSIIAAPSSAAPLYYPTVFQGAVTAHEWQRPMEHYQQQYQQQQQQQQRASTLQYPQEVPQPQQQQQQQEPRVYKATVEMPSPVDSGIGADLSLIASKSEDFYTATEVLHGIQAATSDRTERSLSHRDSPVIIPKL